MNCILKRLKKESINSALIQRLQNTSLIQNKLNTINNQFKAHNLLYCIDGIYHPPNSLYYYHTTSNIIEAIDINNNAFIILAAKCHLNIPKDTNIFNSFKYYLDHPIIIICFLYRDNNNQLSLQKTKTLFFKSINDINNNYIINQFNLQPLI